MTNTPASEDPDTLVTSEGVDEAAPGPAAPDLVGPPATGRPDDGSTPPLDLGGTPATAPASAAAAFFAHRLQFPARRSSAPAAPGA